MSLKAYQKQKYHVVTVCVSILLSKVIMVTIILFFVSVQSK